MRVLYDHQIYLLQKFGGISRYFNEIKKIDEPGFEAASVDADHFLPKPVAPVRRSYVERGYRYVKWKMGYPPNDVQLPSFPPEVDHLFAEGDYDLLHPTYYNPYFLDRNKKPFVITVYDLIHEIYKEYFGFEDHTSHNKRLLCQEAKHIIAISEKTKEDLVKIFRLPAEKITAIPLASTFNEILPQQPQGTAAFGKYILFVGNRNVYKNFFFPLTALAELLKNDPQLNFVCTGPAFVEGELEFFRDLGIMEKMLHIYLKSDEELAWMYQHAALFIFPSLYEGFGFPILEAFASRCPVISSTGGSLPEVAGDAVEYFDPKNFDQIRESASKVLYNQAFQEELIRKGLERFEHFSWDKCRQETMAVYKKVVD